MTAGTLLASAAAATILFTRAPEGAAPWPVLDIYAIEADGSGLRALTRDGHSHDPSWSPDRKRILFIHDAALSPAMKAPHRELAETRTHHPVELAVMDADGGNRRVLRVIEPVIHGPAAWSPDGTTIAVSAATSFTSGTALYLLASSGQEAPRVVRRDAWSPAWSPDGRRLAYVVESPRGSWAIHVSNADGSGEVRLTSPASGASSGPVWSPDGRTLAFTRLTGDGRREQVFTKNAANGTQARQITADEAWSCRVQTWLAGGDRLVADCRSAASPCGMGFYSTGAPMPNCTRRLYTVEARPGGRRRVVLEMR